MEDVDTLSHTTWDCKYHMVLIPKYRRKALYPEIPGALRALLRHRGTQIR
jgi:putative transposase